MDDTPVHGGWLLRSMFYRVHWWISVIDRYVRWSRIDASRQVIYFLRISSYCQSLSSKTHWKIGKSQNVIKLRVFVQPRRIYLFLVYSSGRNHRISTKPQGWKSVIIAVLKTQCRRVNWSRDNINLGEGAGVEGGGPRPSSFTGVVNFENPILFARPFAGEFFKTNLNLPPGCKRWIISFMGRAHRPSAIRHRPVTRVSLTIPSSSDIP